jgi:hypothetical protein
METTLRQHRIRPQILPLLAGLAVALLAGGTPAAASASPPPLTPPRGAPAVDVCGPALPGYARCFARLRTGVHGGTGVRGPLAAARGRPGAAALPAGYGPTDLASAYSLPGTGGAGQTVAVVDAGDDPSAEADLGVYRATYGLPPCTTANGCFTKANQEGAASPLPADIGWGPEISLDLDAVSAACPACHILLVEADDNLISNLASSVDTAVTLGADEVSNSYGSPEQNGMGPYEPHYDHPGVAIVASSGDGGYGIPNFPAILGTVTAVGGTTLTRASTARGWAETAWQGAGSGCSAWIAKPPWQQDPNCPGRMVADVAADADPQTGLAVYDTDGQPGWLEVGGTSAAAPFIAGVIALAGNPGQAASPSYAYSHRGALNDVTGGSNVTGVDCGGDYQCNAVAGYDGPTGYGTPDGTGAF